MVPNAAALVMTAAMVERLLLPASVQLSVTIDTWMIAVVTVVSTVATLL
jgi:hypothetical protein